MKAVVTLAKPLYDLPLTDVNGEEVKISVDGIRSDGIDYGTEYLRLTDIDNECALHLPSDAVFSVTLLVEK